jgi:thiol-disulfide isomerase/thioredoxin
MMNGHVILRPSIVATAFALAIFSAASSAALQPSAASAAEGEAAPSLQLSDAQGSRHSLGDYRGRVVLVNFWTTWCPPCIREIPALEGLARHVADRPFAVLMVNVSESAGVLRRFTRLTEAGIVVLRDADGATARRWGVDGYPTSFVVDAAGRVRAKVFGEEAWDGPEWLALFEALLAEGASETAKQPSHAR